MWKAYLIADRTPYWWKFLWLIWWIPFLHDSEQDEKQARLINGK